MSSAGDTICTPPVNTSVKTGGTNVSVQCKAPVTKSGTASPISKG